MLTALHGPFHVYGLAVDVVAAPPHGGRVCRWCRGEDLDLLGMYRELPSAEAGQLLHVVVSAAGMGGDEVVRQELVPPHPAAAGIEHPLESLQDIRSRLPHEVEDPVADMLRCYLHLPRHMLGDERFQIGGTVPPVGEDHVVAYPGIHEDMPDPVDIGDGLEQGGLTGMIDRKSGAGLPDEASAVLAAAVDGLLGAFDAIHVGRRAADILDHAVETLG